MTTIGEFWLGFLMLMYYQSQSNVFSRGCGTRGRSGGVGWQRDQQFRPQSWMPTTQIILPVCHATTSAQTCVAFHQVQTLIWLPQGLLCHSVHHLLAVVLVSFRYVGCLELTSVLSISSLLCVFQSFTLAISQLLLFPAPLRVWELQVPTLEGNKDNKNKK